MNPKREKVPSPTSKREKHLQLKRESTPAAILAGQWTSGTLALRQEGNNSRSLAAPLLGMTSSMDRDDDAKDGPLANARGWDGKAVMSG
jgi:hypothetical protein